ncbi:MAG: hypothetical protein ACLFV7_09660 [Phycisphaerae bacterium]
METLIQEGAWSGRFVARRKDGTLFPAYAEARRLERQEDMAVAYISPCPPQEATPAAVVQPCREALLPQTGSVLLVGRDELLAEIGGHFRDEGLACDVYPEPTSAIDAASSGHYDLAVMSLDDPDKRPGELLEALSEVRQQTRSLVLYRRLPEDSARSLLEFSPAGCFEVPRQGEEVLPAAMRLIRASRFARFVRATNANLRAWLDSGSDWLEAMGHDPDKAVPFSVSWYMALAQTHLQRIFACIYHLTAGVFGAGQEPPACQFFRCPRLEEMEQSLQEAVDVIEKTRSSFRSKELANLRVRLEETLREVGKN